MKIINIMKVTVAVSVFAILASCTPDDLEGELGALPEPAFTATPLASNPNYIIFRNISAAGFMQEWEFGRDNLKSRKAVDTVHYATKGDYNVTLTVFGSGGLKKLTQKVTVTTDDPCSEPILAKLAGPCGIDSKTWVLKPGAGTLTVGPPDGGVWWSSSAEDVGHAQRVCMFNDEYTFTRDGQFIFNNKGDMRVDDEGGAPWPTDIGLEIGCHDMSAIPAKYHPWGSGTHQFEVTATNLKLKGLGAFMGLYKVGETGTTATPEQEINYQILELTENKLVIRKSYDWGYWKFEFVPKSDEVAGPDLVQGGEMDDPSKWNIFGAGVTLTTTEFVGGGLKFSNGNASAQTNSIVWQAIQVEARKYRFSANVKGSGATNSWLEVFISPTQPVDGSDFNNDLYIGLNTWDGCGNAPFDGNIAVIGCKKIEGQPAPGQGKNGEITFANAGTIYLVFKGGSWDGNLGVDGYTIDNVKLVEIP